MYISLVLTSTMEKRVKEYKYLAEELSTDMYEFERLVNRQTGTEDEEFTRTLLQNVNESGGKILAKVRLYGAFFEMRSSLKKISEITPSMSG
jgi:hypothetical protein